MKPHTPSPTRRHLLRSGAALAAAPAVLPSQSPNKVLGVGIIGLGGISRSHIRQLADLQDKARIVAVCDIYKPRLDWGMTVTKAKGYHDYRDLISDKNVDVVLVLTPDHWHAQMAIDAMRAGKDVDVEKPMALTIEEARHMVRVSEQTGRVLAVDSEHTAHGIWAPAKQALESGVLGKLLWSQTSRSRNSVEPPWHYAIDGDASPRNLDWERFLGSAPMRPFDTERFFRWRRYWDYSGGITTDLYVHHITPLIKITGPEFPVRATASGGHYAYPASSQIEVPDTFIMALDFPSRHTLVCGGSLGNSIELPIVMRGHEANVFFYGPDHRRPDYLIIEPEGPFAGAFREKIRKSGLESEGKWLTEGTARQTPFHLLPAERQEALIAGILGEADVRAEYEDAVRGKPALQSDRKLRVQYFGRIFDERARQSARRARFRVDARPAPSFIEDFIECVHTRRKPVLDGRLGYMVQVAVVMAVKAWREDRVVRFDPKAERLS